MEDTVYAFDQSLALFERAAQVIPGGIYGSKAPGFVVPGSYPYYFVRGEASHLFDVDGNEYIDFLCGYGSQILGYGNPAVDRPALGRITHGDLLNQPAPVMVELAERLTRLMRGMQWTVFAKNGTDVTTLAVSLAKVFTGKRKIIMAKGAYHGTANWCSSNLFPELTEREDVLTFPYNDLKALETLFQTWRGQVAAIILTPYHHPAFGPSIMPDAALYPTVTRLCDQEGALFIMDDIRANFRLSIEGSHAHFGCQPDLVCMGKSIANGYPLSLLMGVERLRKVATSFFISGTFWTSAAPMVAAMACLDVMQSLDAVARMNALGGLLREGLTEAAAAEGLEVQFSGPPAIPFMTFAGDPNLYRNQVFCAEMTRRGVYLHPHHNWFISCAHTEADMARTASLARTCFRLTREAGHS